LKNLLDWLSISFDNYSYNELFKDKDVAIISSVDGKGNNAKNAFDLLGAQLSNYGLNVYENFYLFNEEDKVDDLLTNDSKSKDFFSYIESFLRS
jgi:NAD(P)H-dependent FMN reductase